MIPNIYSCTIATILVFVNFQVKNRGLVDESAILRIYGGWGTKLNHHRRCNVTTKQFYYTDPYAHLNNLFDFKPVVNYTRLLYPTQCPAKTSDSDILILFGIKSMPKRAAMRDAIRNTWLNANYWKFTGNSHVIIHPIFLLGTQNGYNLTKEADENNDILQYDFIESHYNLTVKEIELQISISRPFSLLFFLTLPHVQYFIVPWVGADSFDLAHDLINHFDVWMDKAGLSQICPPTLALTLRTGSKTWPDQQIWPQL